MTPKAVRLFLTTFGLFVLLIKVTYDLSQISWFYVLLLALPLHWLHARLFVIMHDCGHDSFTKNSMLNQIIGHICGLFFYTPFLMWQQLHNRHHQNQGNLDRRGRSLDVWILTKSEYDQSSSIKKILYRMYRNPLILLILSPFVLFIFIFRIPFENFRTKALINIFLLDALLVFIFWLAWKTIGLQKFLLLQLSWMSLSFCLAAWLFYIQHQFEKTVWFSQKNYNFEQVALQGSSYYALPAWLNWVTGDIGYHHVHHLDVKIPMYNLQKAHQALMQQISLRPFASLTLKESWKTIDLKLWDENQQKMIPFKTLPKNTKKIIDSN